jgi:L-fucose isomerase-like protein
LKPEFHWLPVASSFLIEEEFQGVVREYSGSLERAGGMMIGPESVGGPARLAFLVVTGGTEGRILELACERALTHPDEPVVLVAYPWRNSLPAAMEVLARLQQDGVAGRIVFLDGARDKVGAGRLRAAIEGGDAEVPHIASETHARKPQGRPLPGRRIGLVGAPSDWLVASSPSPSLVRDVWGAEVIEIGMGDLRQRVDAAEQAGGASGATVDAFAESFRAQASGVREPSDADLAASGAIHVALRSLVDELRLDAITVRCFDLVTERGATGCLALSRLADEGVVAGCEGDLVSVLTMLWVRERLGGPSWMANPARVEIATNTLTLAHCTVPCSIVDAFTLRSHFESGLGAAVQANLRRGLVRLARIGGGGLDRVWVAEGVVTAVGGDERMCRTQADVVLTGGGTVADLLERPLGNHLVLVR